VRTPPKACSEYRRLGRVTFELADHPCPWGGRQPRFDALVRERDILDVALEPVDELDR
jgi:hypothetical protein